MPLLKLTVVERGWRVYVCVHVRYVGGYHGLLSGVTVRPGSVEPHSVVECLYACREGLDFGDLETLGSGMKVTPQRTEECHAGERDEAQRVSGVKIYTFNQI